MQLITTKITLQKKLKGIVKVEEKGNHNHDNMGKNKTQKMSKRANEE
jgi:hypothetical protein